MQKETINQNNIKILNLQDYLQGEITKDADDLMSAAKITTGFENLDKITPLYPGLYVLGATSSLGKTTFIHQLGDQIAQKGNPVLYISLEQSCLELASKSLARIMAREYPKQSLSAIEIRTDIHNPLVQKAISSYSEYAKIITIVEGSFDLDMDKVEEIIANQINQQETKPVVIIDYLQLLRCISPNIHSTKDMVDACVQRLKQIQLKHKLVLFLISSLNRQNYMNQIDYESFKESGGIEYTADVIWGMQLNILNSPEFLKETSLDKKREMLRNAKAEEPRKIELVCLKNRFGISSYKAKFDYYPRCDLFKANLINDDDFMPYNKRRDGTLPY